MYQKINLTVGAKQKDCFDLIYVTIVLALSSARAMLTLARRSYTAQIRHFGLLCTVMDLAYRPAMTFMRLRSGAAEN